MTPIKGDKRARSSEGILESEEGISEDQLDQVVGGFGFFSHNFENPWLGHPVDQPSNTPPPPEPPPTSNAHTNTPSHSEPSPLSQTAPNTSSSPGIMQVGSSLLSGGGEPAPAFRNTGETGATATAGTGSMSAYASTGASLGHTERYDAGNGVDATQRTTLSAGAQAQAGVGYASAGATVGAGHSTTFDVGKGVEIEVRSEATAKGGGSLGLDPTQRGLVAEGTASANIHDRVEQRYTSDAFGDGARVTQSSHVETGVGAEAKGTAGVGLTGMHYETSTSAGAYVTAGGEVGIGNKEATANLGGAVISPGSVGSGMSGMAHFDDGKLSLGLETEVAIGIGGFKMDISLDLQLFDNTHTRGSEAEIAAAERELAFHINNYDENMTFRWQEDARNDLRHAQESLNMAHSQGERLACMYYYDKDPNAAVPRGGFFSMPASDNSYATLHPGAGLNAFMASLTPEQQSKLHADGHGDIHLPKQGESSYAFLTGLSTDQTRLLMTAQEMQKHPGAHTAQIADMVEKRMGNTELVSLIHAVEHRVSLTSEVVHIAQQNLDFANSTTFCTAANAATRAVNAATHELNEAKGFYELLVNDEKRAMHEVFGADLSPHGRVVIPTAGQHLFLSSLTPDQRQAIEVEGDSMVVKTGERVHDFLDSLTREQAQLFVTERFPNKLDAGQLTMAMRHVDDVIRFGDKIQQQEQKIAEASHHLETVQGQMTNVHPLWRMQQQAHYVGAYQENLGKQQAEFRATHPQIDPYQKALMNNSYEAASLLTNMLGNDSNTFKNTIQNLESLKISTEEKLNHLREEVTDPGVLSYLEDVGDSISSWFS